MTVTFTGHSYRDKHEVHVRVAGAPPIKLTDDGRWIAPERAEIRYVCEDAEGWEAALVTISGGLLNQNGTPGAQIRSERLYPSKRGSWPGWVDCLVDSSKPLAHVAREPLMAT